ncbi:uroporphyrinogen-III synthase [Martelella lutilitoris]|uniref:Uroporphyrinogen-III synthase n=1 Tax=Martelella lutilitoris TaxID=2583532 RepID=A0A5C4JQR7_9HYPH|nr:uroporphyrinogen-III synthase [Martelella lutilitoris]TNB47542.1 uroporphyrinogen-III synthase [Martelella lutilitoris]
MRVLVTRPQEKAERTCARLAAMGHEAFSLPLFQPVHFDDVVKTALRAGNWRALAITSAEALENVEASRDAPGLNYVPVFAVGRKTAEAARAAGFLQVIDGGGDGERLAKTIAAFPPPDDGPLLYLAGDPRAPVFEETLRWLDVAFETVTAYAMRPVTDLPVETVLDAAKPEAVLFYSAAAAARFFTLASPLLLAEHGLNLQFLCLSAKVAAAVPPSLSSSARIAGAPDEDSLLSLLN